MPNDVGTPTAMPAVPKPPDLCPADENREDSDDERSNDFMKLALLEELSHSSAAAAPRANQPAGGHRYALRKYGPVD